MGMVNTKCQEQVIDWMALQYWVPKKLHTNSWVGMRQLISTSEFIIERVILNLFSIKNKLHYAFFPPPPPSARARGGGGVK